MDNRNKLSLNDKDLLASIKGLEVHKSLLRAIELEVESFGRAVLQVDLSTKSDRELVIMKAQAEGAAKLALNIKNLLDRLATPK